MLERRTNDDYTSKCFANKVIVGLFKLVGIGYRQCSEKHEKQKRVNKLNLKIKQSGWPFGLYRGCKQHLSSNELGLNQTQRFHARSLWTKAKITLKKANQPGSNFFACSKSDRNETKRLQLTRALAVLVSSHEPGNFSRTNLGESKSVNMCTLINRIRWPDRFDLSF